MFFYSSFSGILIRSRAYLNIILEKNPLNSTWKFALCYLVSTLLNIPQDTLFQNSNTKHYIKHKF